MGPSSAAYSQLSSVLISTPPCAQPWLPASELIVPSPLPLAAGEGEEWDAPPPELGLSGSAVGVDLPVFRRMQALGAKAKWIRFVGYGPYYAKAFEWRMGFSEFGNSAVLVESAQFMPQMMAAISGMAVFVPR